MHVYVSSFICRVLPVTNAGACKLTLIHSLCKKMRTFVSSKSFSGCNVPAAGTDRVFCQSHQKFPNCGPVNPQRTHADAKGQPWLSILTYSHDSHSTATRSSQYLCTHKKKAELHIMPDPDEIQSSAAADAPTYTNPSASSHHHVYTGTMKPAPQHIRTRDDPPTLMVYVSFPPRPPQ